MISSAETTTTVAIIPKLDIASPRRFPILVLFQTAGRCSALIPPADFWCDDSPLPPCQRLSPCRIYCGHSSSTLQMERNENSQLGSSLKNHCSASRPKYFARLVARLDCF